MEEGLIKILKSLKLIKPDEGFVSHSRQSIIGLDGRPIRVGILESLKLAAALTLASVLVLVFASGISAPSVLTNLNQKNLETEIKNLDFQIKLGEVSYYIETEKELSVQIDKIINDLSL